MTDEKEEQIVGEEGKEIEAQEKVEPQYATKDDLKGVLEAIQGIAQKVEKLGAEELDADDLDQVSKAWEETFGRGQKSKAEPEEPEDLSDPKQLRDSLRKEIQDSIKQVMGAIGPSMLEMRLMQARMNPKYPEWAELEPEILKMSKKHRSLEEPELYILAKAQKVGFENLTKPEQKKAGEAAIAAKEAKRAATEKPSSGGTKAKREPLSFAEAASMAFDELEASSSK